MKPVVLILLACRLFAGVSSSAVNDPNTREVVGPDCTGAAVVRAQILLDRAHFSPAEITGRYNPNLRIAIYGYQSARKLPMTGVVDPATWQSLNRDTEKVLIEYALRPEDVKGPFQRTPLTITEMARMRWLTYESPEQELGEMFHISPDLLAALNPGVNFRKAGQRILVPHVQKDAGLLMAHQIILSKSNRSVTVFTELGHVVAQYPATMGSEEDPYPVGNWAVSGVQFTPSFFYNPKRFWNGTTLDAQATIAPGPHNPAGTVWIGLDRLNYGIHGTPDPGRIGQTEKKGCIRLTNWDAMELSGLVHKGTPLAFRE
jgi:lipoprotein-anchoring transpeptidase ErfK/SrfK